MRLGRQEKLPYSLSRWTDLPGAKWPWFQQQLDQGWMVAFDPRTAVPSKWSLKVEDTYGLIFWTRDATNLVQAAARLQDYPLVVHYTLTGWHEVEKGSPSVEQALETMGATVDAFGAENVTWRFSPIPLVDDVLDRFEQIATGVAGLGIQEVYLSFLQENDLLPETRPARLRRELLKQMASRTKLQIRLCAEDQALSPIGFDGSTAIRRHDDPPQLHNQWGPLNLARGICESGLRFAGSNMGVDYPPTEGCGCALAVDPFTVNESCTFGCGYCYAADKSLAPKKRNTTKLPRHLKVLP